jgi:hypothetical protein
MYALNACASFKINQPSETYIFDIISTADGIVAISSDDTLRLLDPALLHGQPLYTIPHIQDQVTCLKALDGHNSVVCTAGRDGRLSILDLRNRSKVADLAVGERKFPFPHSYSSKANFVKIML